MLFDHAPRLSGAPSLPCQPKKATRLAMIVRGSSRAIASHPNGSSTKTKRRHGCADPGSLRIGRRQGFDVLVNHIGLPDTRDLNNYPAPYRGTKTHATGIPIARTRKKHCPPDHSKRIQRLRLRPVKDRCRQRHLRRTPHLNKMTLGPTNGHQHPRTKDVHSCAPTRRTDRPLTLPSFPPWRRGPRRPKGPPQQAPLGAGCARRGPRASS